MREPSLFVATGYKGSGKTWLTARELESYLMNDPNTARRGRRGLIFDVNMEEEWKKYKTLYFDIEEKDEWVRGEEIRKFCQTNNPEGRRIVPMKKNRRPMTPEEYVSTIRTIANSYSNGLFIAEDLNKYISSKNQDEILGLLTTLRHSGIDMYLHLQTLSKLTTTMWENVDYIRFHKQSDSIDRYKGRIPNYTIMKICELIVNRKYREGDVRYCLYVSPVKERIFNISESDFSQACKEYLAFDNKQVITLMREVNDMGGKKFSDRNQAMQYWIENHLYYIS